MKESLLLFINLRCQAQSSFPSEGELPLQPLRCHFRKISAMSTSFRGSPLTLFGPSGRFGRLPQEIIDLVWYHASFRDKVVSWSLWELGEKKNVATKLTSQGKCAICSRKLDNFYALRNHLEGEDGHRDKEVKLWRRPGNAADVFVVGPSHAEHGLTQAKLFVEMWY